MRARGPHRATREHILPRQKFHVIDKSIRKHVLWQNVIAACRICNQEKSSSTLVEYLEWLLLYDRKRARLIEAMIMTIKTKHPGDVGKYIVGELQMGGLLIINGEPPLMDEIDRVFKVRGRDGIVFAFGDRVYAPGQDRLPPAIMAHERVRCDRQMLFAGGVVPWWRCYLDDPQFRLNEEIVAHRAEWRWHCDQPQANKPVQGFRSGRLYHLHQIANRLASSLYGDIIDVRKARNLIEAA